MLKEDILKEVEGSSSSSSEETDDSNAKEEEDFRDPCPQIDMVTLISNDGCKFHVQRKVAIMSDLLKCVFEPESHFKESVKNEYRFSNIRGAVLERVVDYMHHKYMYKDDISSAPRFDVKDDILLETFVAADYLII